MAAGLPSERGVATVQVSPSSFLVLPLCALLPHGRIQRAAIDREGSTSSLVRVGRLGQVAVSGSFRDEKRARKQQEGGKHQIHARNTAITRDMPEGEGEYRLPQQDDVSKPF